MSYTIWFTGMSGSGKTTLSTLVFEELIKRGRAAEHLDGDVIRKNFSQELGFSQAARDMNVRRIGFFTQMLNKHGVICVVAAIAPYAQSREHNRDHIGRYIEVFCDCDLDTLIARDPKGLYKKALQGEIANFTGISDPYEHPRSPEVHVRTGKETVEQSLATILTFLEGEGLLNATTP
ncbi:MAG: adenylyl-sulfate kinase [Desulfovibrio sp.]|nr:MAG: adenylyl-sulfate kinase [Desulfovibrio sp.]